MFSKVLLPLLAGGLSTLATAQTEDAAASAKARQIQQDLIRVRLIEIANYSPSR